MGCFVKLQRPGFTEMMDAVESGAVKTVVTKDLSRLGRNYLQVGLFTEITFPKKGVRFIAINDGVDSVSGRITDERFMELSTDYEQEQATLKARAAELQAELGQAQEAAVNVEKFMAVVRKYTSFEELTPTLLREFVEKIVVHECWKDEQGTRHQDIEIYYSFVGKVDLPDD